MKFKKELEAKLSQKDTALKDVGEQKKLEIDKLKTYKK